MSDLPPLTLALTGDSMLTRHAAPRADEATARLLDLIEGADVAFTNLEVVPNSFRGYPSSSSGGTHMAADARVLDDLAAIGFTLFASATNHSLDYHIEGVLATLEAIEQRGLAVAGLGRTLAEARMPAYLGHPKGVVGLVACCSTFAPGQEAGDQRPDLQGRPGINPLRFDAVYEVTREQLDALRAIPEGTGLEAVRQHTIQLGFSFPPDDPAIVPFLGGQFREAEHVGVRTTPRPKDLEALAAWTREARTRAEYVVVSYHGHETGPSGHDEEPAEFQRLFAHRMIDEGADVVVGHGPHLLRGLEIYQGKPIFYSLGNFVAQNDLVYKLPADAYDRFRVDPAATPSQLFRQRSLDGQKGFPADSRYWESVVPRLRFEAGRLAAIELHPIELGHRQPVMRRGLPRLAGGERAGAILERFAALCEPLGTRLAIDGERATVVLDA